MKILHQVGFRPNWNLDALYQNGIGDGFIFCAFNIEARYIGKNISGYEPADYLPISMLDLQYFGSKKSKNLGKFKSYPLHPANSKRSDKTEIEGIENIFAGIEYQEKKGFKNIIIPSYYYDYKKNKKFISILNAINKRLKKKPGFNYYMTIPFDHITILDELLVEKILFELTDMKIKFDGYYIICESNPGFRKKISDDFDYYRNLSHIFKVLKGQEFKIIHGYSNFDSLIFTTQSMIDFVTIGTFENLRNFSITRYTNQMQGGPSEGWYFSEKLLNVIKAKDLKLIRRLGALDLIKNEKNIFSDIIIDRDYVWNSNKVDVHKNYLLSISRFLSQINQIKNLRDKQKFLLKKVVEARSIYEELERKKVYLIDESSDYHLSTWYSFLKQSI